MKDTLSWDDAVEMVYVVAGCVIKQDNKYLLVQEKQHSAYSLWNIPAGHVDKGETLEQAAIREAKEESGYDVKIIDELQIHHSYADDSVKHAFSTVIVGGKLKIQPEEIIDAEWLTYKQIVDLHDAGKLRSSWVLEAVSQVEHTA